MIKKIHKAGKQLRINLPEFTKTDKDLGLSQGSLVQFSKIKLPNGTHALILCKIEPLPTNILLSHKGRKQ